MLPDVADAGGLAILMKIQKMFSHNVDISILLAKIISNLSLHSEYLDDIFKSGKKIIASKSKNNII